MAEVASSAPDLHGGLTKRRGSLLWIQGLACGALLTFAAPTALLLAVLQAPALLCMLADTKRDPGLLRAIGLACAAASVRPLWHLWLTGDRLDQATAALSDPLVLLLAWGGGAGAWALCQILPVMLHSVWDMREASRLHAIERELKQLRSEWTLDSAP